MSLQDVGILCIERGKKSLTQTFLGDPFLLFTFMGKILCQQRLILYIELEAAGMVNGGGMPSRQGRLGKSLLRLDSLTSVKLMGW